VRLQPGLVLRWSEPGGGPPKGSGAAGIRLAQVRAVSGELHLSLLKKISDAMMGFEGKASGIAGHFALRIKRCLTVGGPRRTLDLQAPSEHIKDEWVSALQLMVVYAKLGSLAAHAERVKLEEALVSRRFEQQALAGHTSAASGQLERRIGFLSFAPKHIQEWGDNFGSPRKPTSQSTSQSSQFLRKTNLRADSWAARKTGSGASDASVALADALARAWGTPGPSKSESQPRASAVALIDPCD